MQKFSDMIGTLLLIIFAGVFAAVAALRQYLESSNFPKQRTFWNKIGLFVSNPTIVFISLAAICAGWASVRQYLDNDRVSKENGELQGRLVKYTFGSSEVPAFTASILGNVVLFSVSNPDTSYPMYNVRVKCRETFYPDVGTLYPNVNKILESKDLSGKAGDEWYFVIWYNNIKSLEADIEVKRNSQGDLIASTRYLDEHQKEFIPPWKKRADSLNGIKDTTKHHYQPSQHF